MKFGYTILYVNNVDRAIQFYEDAFGQKRKFVHEGGYGELDTGETTLAFVSVEAAKAAGVSFLPPTTEGPSHPVEVAFVTDDVQAKYDQAIAAGAVGVLEPTEKPWGQTISYVRDLEGFIVEICSAVLD